MSMSVGSRTTVSTTGHRDVATLEAITYQASRQLSTSSTTVDIHFRFNKLLFIFIFQQLVDKMLPIRDENAHQTLFSNNIFKDTTCADDNFTRHK